MPKGSVAQLRRSLEEMSQEKQSEEIELEEEQVLTR
jgi:hypothetical protein